jgi:hypothetical protein
VGALVILLPSATITLSPVRTDAAYNLALTLDPRAETTHTAGILPARPLTRTLTGSIRVTTTGTTQVASTAAGGQVTFINQTDEAVLIPVGTGVLPSGRPDLRFETLEDVTLESGRDATVQARVVASRPGPAGNLPSGTLNAIDGPLGLKAAVTQPEALTGGTEAERPAVAAADQANAQRLLTEQLLAQAAADLRAALASDEELAESSLRVVNTAQRDFDRPLGAAGDSVGLEMTLEIAALSYRPSQLEAAVEKALAERGGTGARTVPGSRRVLQATGDPAHPDVLSVEVEEELYSPQDLQQVRRRARGLSVADAASELGKLEGLASSPVVTLRPAWWPVLPWLEVRLEVRYAWEAR